MKRQVVVLEKKLTCDHQWVQAKGTRQMKCRKCGILKPVSEVRGEPF